mmetsp:Transcript_4061/g.6929  ORF Transcript_4061/g.6929 Transcript_4061/m.6929 type:complete len:87 (-) Transcript_4061:35-295(-)
MSSWIVGSKGGSVLVVQKHPPLCKSNNNSNNNCDGQINNTIHTYYILYYIYLHSVTRLKFFFLCRNQTKYVFVFFFSFQLKTTEYI